MAVLFVLLCCESCQHVNTVLAFIVIAVVSEISQSSNENLMHVVAVALNYQTCGLMMDLSDGRFMQNGGCGYILKPAVMRDEIAYFRAGTRDIIPGISPQILQIKVCITVIVGDIFISPILLIGPDTFF